MPNVVKLRLYQFAQTLRKGKMVLLPPAAVPHISQSPVPKIRGLTAFIERAGEP